MFHSKTVSLFAAAVTAAFVFAGTANAALLLINFDEVTSYTSDGTNTWQTFDLSEGSVNGSNAFVPVTGVTLADTTGSTAAGYTLDISGSVTSGSTIAENVGPNAGDPVVDGDGNPTTLPAWFDSSSAEQRSGHNIRIHPSLENQVLTYAFSGFQTTDTVKFEFVFGKTNGTGDRTIDLGLNTREDILDGVDADGQFAVGVTNVTGSTSYSFTVQGNQGANSWGPGGNAIGVTVTPIPEPASLAMGLFGLTLIAGRRRR